MKFLRKNWLLSIVLLFTVATLAACGGGNSNNDNNDSNVDENGDPKPVTLKFNYAWEDEFIEDIKEPVEEKFPHITLEFDDTALDEVEEEIARGNIPDIFYLSGADQVTMLDEYELAYDLTELIEKNDFDLSAISEPHIEVVEKWSDGGMNFLPYVRRWNVLYYNKDVFDRFGVDYPEDGMSWKEITKLARDVTGEIDGTEYRGIDISSADGMLEQLNVNHVDPETDESLYAKDDNFDKYLRLVEEIASIPGVVPEDEEVDWGAFIGDQNVAMVPLFDIHIWLSGVEDDTGMNWDMVSYPTWEEHPERGTLANAGGLSISSTSEHKDAAFQVLEYLLSEEWQTMRSEKGFAPILNDEAVQEAFSTDIEGLVNKNMQAVFYLDETSGAEKTSIYEEEGNIIDALEFIREGKDVNTYLRELSEEADLEIHDAKGSN